MKDIPVRVLIAALLLAVPAYAADPPTPAVLSGNLARNCADLRTAFKTAPAPEVPIGKCTEAAPTADDLKACRETLASISTKAFTDDVAKLIETHHKDLRDLFTSDSKTIQRLHVVLGGRQEELEQVVRKAATAAYADFEAPEAPATLLDAAKKKIAEVEETVGDRLFNACIAGDAAIIRAAFPSALTIEEQAAISTQRARDVVEEAEKDEFAEFSKATGFTRSVECLWAPPVQGSTTRSTLTCKPGLLVSGEEVSEIIITGVPAGEPVHVIAMHAEELHRSRKANLIEATTCPREGKNLSCDEMTVPADDPRPLLIAVHTLRLVNPTWGGFLGMTSSAERALRTVKDRTKLSLVTDGAPATIAVGVKVGSDFASARVPVGYARWKIESGGFFSVSNQVDHEVMTEPVASTENVTIIGVRDTDHVVQDSGIFVNFIPQNYQAVGASLGFATPSNRRMSVLLGSSVRVRTFGNRGLASLAAGLAMRSVLRFPDATFGRVVEADSRVLQGEENFRFGWFVAVNLGFRIGAFGPQDEKEDE